MNSDPFQQGRRSLVIRLVISSWKNGFKYFTATAREKEVSREEEGEMYIIFEVIRKTFVAVSGAFTVQSCWYLHVLNVSTSELLTSPV